MIKIIFLTFLLKASIESILKFQFLTDSEKYDGKIPLIDYLSNNNIYIEFPVGTPKKLIPTYISLNQFTYYITGKNLSGIYNEAASSSYHKMNDKETSFYQDNFEKGYISQENIYLTNLENKEIEISKFTFVLPSKEGKKIFPSLIGLGIDSYYTKETGFIYQLKQKEIIKSYGWTIKYLDKYKGEIIFGGYPHEYDNNYDESKFKNAKAENRGNYIYWDLSFNSIKWNTFFFNYTNFTNLLIAELNINSGTIIAPGFFKKIFWDNLFNNNNCESIFHENKFYYFVCNNNFKMKNFGSLFFYNKDFEYSFEINYKDLFYEHEKKIYFLIFFSSSEYDRWTLGKPFFKNYQIIFEPDRKLIGFYNGKSFKFLTFSWIIVYILGIIIILLGSYMIYKYKKLPIRIKAKELDDNEIYDSYKKIDGKTTLGI